MKKNQIFALVLVLLCGLAISACTQSNAMTGGSSWPGMTAEDGIVYTANGTFVEAIQDGKKLWSSPAEANKRLSFFAAPAAVACFRQNAAGYYLRNAAEKKVYYEKNHRCGR